MVGKPPFKVTEKIDRYKPVHLDFPDPKILALFASLDFTIRQVQTQTLGPYGAIESVISAMEDFAEEWNA